MKYMSIALEEAQKAYTEDEVPVGCVITSGGKIVSQSHNTSAREKNALCHAEIYAINNAIAYLGTKELNDCDLYVTLEPCPMCAGAIINSKIKRVYIGAMEPKSGCFGSVADFCSVGFNHHPEVYYGINEDECKKILVDFFKNKR